jgi:hypothetical protein
MIGSISHKQVLVHIKAQVNNDTNNSGCFNEIAKALCGYRFGLIVEPHELSKTISTSKAFPNVRVLCPECEQHLDFPLLMLGIA